MIIVDTALRKREEEGRPIRAAVVGAGYIGRGLAKQILQYLPGMDMVAMSNRSLERAEEAYGEAGIDSATRVTSVGELEDAVAAGRYAVTDDALLLCRAEGIDVVLEAVGHVEFGAGVVTEAIAHGKHITSANAELDATAGPILKVQADKAGVVYSGCDGDQPGVVMNLIRFVTAIGYEPVLAGNIKGLLDPYRTPETQAGFAARHGQSPKMATSFADGTKLAMEMAVVANATGLQAGKRGMHGPSCAHVNESIDLFPHDQLLDGGIVDFVLGAEPGPGVFVIGHNDDPARGPYMEYFKLGPGPFHVFYVPYHLPHLEMPLTAARAVLFGDAAIAPQGGPVCDVITVAKRDLRSGQLLDGIGGFDCYGLLENSDTAARDALLPMGLSEGCTLTRDIPKDAPVRYTDVVLPSGRLVDRLRDEQDAHFPVAVDSVR